MSDEKTNNETTKVSDGQERLEQDQIMREEPSDSDTNERITEQNGPDAAEQLNASEEEVVLEQSDPVLNEDALNERESDDSVTPNQEMPVSQSELVHGNADSAPFEGDASNQVGLKDWSSVENPGPLEIESTGTRSDGSIALKINGVEVGPLTHIDRTLANTNEQIAKAKNLIYVTGGIGAFILIFSTFFFLLMSVQLSTKTDELDQMLVALGKRGIQLGDGIEELTKIEEELLEMRGIHSLLVSDISMLKASNEEQFSGLERMIVALESSNRALQEDLAELKTDTQDVKEVVGDGLTRAQKEIVGEFSDSSKGQAILSDRVSQLISEQAELALKLEDLYLIQRAELEGRLNLD